MHESALLAWADHSDSGAWASCHGLACRHTARGVAGVRGFTLQWRVRENRCRRLRNIRQSNKGLRGGDTPLPKHVEEKLCDVGAGKAVPLRDGVDDLGPEAGPRSST